MGVCHSAICKTFSVSWFCIDLLLIRGGLGSVDHVYIYIHSAIYKTFSVYWFCIDLLLIRGGGGVSLPWIYVHSSIYETFSL